MEFSDFFGLMKVFTVQMHDNIEVWHGWWALIAIFIAVWVIIAILIMVWVYRDAESRGESGILWLLIVLLLSIIGLIIWLLVRPEKRPPTEKALVRVLICPYCRAENAPTTKFCRNCGASIE